MKSTVDELKSSMLCLLGTIIIIQLVNLRIPLFDPWPNGVQQHKDQFPRLLEINFCLKSTGYGTFRGFTGNWTSCEDIFAYLV